MVKFDLSLELNYDVQQPTDFEFMVHAAKTKQQRVVSEKFFTTPQLNFKPEVCAFFGNRHVRMHADVGPLKINYSGVVEVHHHTAQPESLCEIPVSALPFEVLHYLRPSRYCPSDSFFQMAVQEFGNMQPGYVRVQAICDWVRERTRFQVGTSNTFSTAIDTFTNGVGVCRDFAHLMITMCRTLNIPARYVTGIDFGADPALGPMDFHAYVEVFLSDRWYIFDATGICHTTGLVRIATGHDANDVPFATIFGKVVGYQPILTMIALDDAAAGIALPGDTDSAISTFGVDFPQTNLPPALQKVPQELAMAE